MAAPTEVWKSIPTFTTYEASSSGQVRHATTKRILKPVPNTKGYLRVFVRGRYRLLAGLIALTFLGPPPEGHVINHRNAVKSDNSVDNLEYLTPEANREHAKKMGLYHTHKGEMHPRAKLSNWKVRLIRRLRQDKVLNGVALAKMFGVTSPTIYGICAGRSWRHVAPEPGPEAVTLPAAIAS